MGKKKTIECKDTITIITNQYNNCKQDKEKEIAKWEQCNKTNIELKVEIEKKITIINTVNRECQSKIDKKITEIREEEKNECKKKITIEINHFKYCESEKLTIINQRNTCRTELNVLI